MRLLLLTAFFACFFASCITTKKYEDLEILKNHFKAQNDSLRSAQSDQQYLVSDLKKVERLSLIHI